MAKEGKVRRCDLHEAEDLEVLVWKESFQLVPVPCFVADQAVEAPDWASEQCVQMRNRELFAQLRALQKVFNFYFLPFFSFFREE